MKSMLGRCVAVALAAVATWSVERQAYGVCAPNCADARQACGPDGCGGTCGTCAAGDTCSASGQCISGCAANNNGMPCTATEQRFLNKSAACYNCLVSAGCLNNSVFGDTGHECEDVPGTAVNGAQAGVSRSTLCLKTLDCIFGTGCASSDVAICYCGALGIGSSCTQATSGANGPCFEQEVDALEHLATDAPSIIAPDYYNQNLGGGKANQLFSCASAEICPMCLQPDPPPVPALPPFGVAALSAGLIGLGASFAGRRHPAQPWSPRGSR